MSGCETPPGGEWFFFSCHFELEREILYDRHYFAIVQDDKDDCIQSFVLLFLSQYHPKLKAITP